MRCPSEGWPSRYALDSSTRRADEQYAEKQAIYTQSSHQLGWLRSDLLSFAAEVGMQPPLTRSDIRSGMRDTEIVQTLGQSGQSMLAEHAVAVDTNFWAMISLRDEANRLAAELGN